MSDSSDSSAGKGRNRSRSQDKAPVNKLFITNIDGKVTFYLSRLRSLKSRLNSKNFSKSMEKLETSLPNATETQSTALPLSK